MDEKTIARFWKKVDKAGPIPAHRAELGPCWPWTGKRNGFGYGIFTGGRGRKDQRAHRASWSLAHAHPGELLVLHKCDNPACVRPAHLFLGTQLDNVTDMRLKRRGANPPVRRGASNNRTRITAEQVQEIRVLYASGISQAELGKRYGMKQGKISDIVLCRAWRHLPGAVPQVRKTEDRSNVRLTSDDVRNMRELYRAGTTIRALAESYGMCVNATRNAVTGKTWRSVA